MKLIKQLKGYSGSKILLVEDPDLRVRKVYNVARNLERLSAFERLNVSCPRVLKQTKDSYDMEYILGLDIKTYLSLHSIAKLSDFLKNTINLFSKDATQKDYTKVFNDKLESVDFSELCFNKQELLQLLPKYLPCSEYHGDFTLENILYDTKKDKFVLIDPLTSVYDSFVFDMAKLRQDISCYWFIRETETVIKPKLKSLYDSLVGYEHFKDDSLLILMLLRVLPYANEKDKLFLKNEVTKLWKSLCHALG